MRCSYSVAIVVCGPENCRLPTTSEMFGSGSRDAVVLVMHIPPCSGGFLGDGGELVGEQPDPSGGELDVQGCGLAVELDVVY